jgi:hypothetical protein
VTLPNASSATYVIGGGTSPYSATSANTSVAAVSVSGSTLTINAGTSGSTTVTVRDNAGHTIPVSVTVAPAFNFFTTAPSAVTVAVNSTATFSVGGGVPPYVATSGSPGVATASISGNTLSIKGLSNGTAPVVLRDAALTTIPITVTVSPASSLSLFTTAPATGLTVAKGTNTTFAIGGGAPPYTVTSSNTSVASVVLSGSSYTITGVANGVASLSIRDSAGTAIPVAVTVSAAQLSLNPTAVSAFLGDTVFSTISGGTAPFSVVEGFPDAADVDIGSLVNDVFVPSVTGEGNILRVVIKQVVATDIIQVRDATGNSVSFTLTATAGTNAITLAPSTLTVGEEFSGSIRLVLFGGVGITNIFSSNTDLITVPGPVTGSAAGTPVTVTKTLTEVCNTGEVTITAIDSLGAKAETLITIEDHGNNPDPCPPVAPTPTL